MAKTFKTLDRQGHEELAIVYLDESQHDLIRVANCDLRSLKDLVAARQSVSLARAHLVSIGPHEGPRTRKLWGAVGRAERRLDEKLNKFGRCLDTHRELSGLKTRKTRKTRKSRR